MSARQRNKGSKKSSAAAPEVVPPSGSMETIEEVEDKNERSTRRNSASRTRSASPLSISRLEEKEEIANLNDRLASYIDYVHNIEIKNERLHRRVTSTTENLQIDVSSIRAQYDNEIVTMRATLDDLSTSKAKAEMLRKRAEEEAAEALKAKREAEDRAAVFAAKVDQLTKQIDKEILSRTKLENRLQSMEEELNFQRRVHQEEVSQLKKTTVMEVEEQVKTASKDEYESRLAEELRALRAETADELEAYRIQLENDFNTQFKALEESRTYHLDEISSLRVELSRYKQQSESSETELTTLRARCQRLENELMSQRESYETELERQKTIETRLREQIEIQLKDFADLMTAKVALDQEILAYRKMLESEEARLQITPPATQRETSFSSIGRASAIKRRRVDIDEAGDSASKSYSMRSRGNENVIIEEVDAEKGRYVRLTCQNTDEVPIGNWVLKYTANGKEVEYKFNRNVVLKPRDSLTVWSSDSADVPNKPNNFVMKGVSFLPGSQVDVSLVDADGKEQAGMTIQQEEIVLSRRRTASTGRLTSRRGDVVARSDDEKCAVM